MPSTFSTTEQLGLTHQEIWGALIDIRHLMRWIPALDELHQLDEGDPGRGSVLSARTGDRRLDLTISYWEPEKGLTVVYNNDRYVLESALRLVPLRDGTNVCITLNLQGRGLWRFLSPLLLYLRSRSVKAWLATARNELENHRPSLADTPDANRDSGPV